MFSFHTHFKADLRGWLALCLATAVLGIHALANAGAPDLPAVDVENGDSYHVSRFLTYLEDPAHTLNVDDVTAANALARFQPATLSKINDVNFGYSASTYWLALPLHVTAGAPTQWLLEIGYPSLDRVEVYTRRADGSGFDMQTAGDLRPFAERLYPHRNLVFPLHLTANDQNTTQTIYLKVTSEGNLTIPVTLWQPAALAQHDRYAYAGLSLYYGMLLALGIYNLLLFFAIRDKVFLTYVAFVAAMAMGQASMNGFGNQFVWPDWPAWGNIALPSGMALAGMFGAVFTHQFLGMRQTAPQLNRIVLLMAGVFAFCALSPLLVSYRFSAIAVSVSGIVFSVIATISGVYCLRKGHPGARYFLLAWALLLTGVAVLALRNLSWLPTNTLTLYAMQIGSALEILLLSFALADRINVMQRAKDGATQEMINAKQMLVDTLRSSELELESRIHERTRDLQAANTQLVAQERELKRMAQHDALTGLANRTLLDDRLHQAVARAQRSKQQMAVLLVDLDGFKTVNDTHGHSVGDQLLIALALRLTGSVRQTDTVARFGGDEFVIVLENLHSPEEAVQVAEKVLAEIMRPVDLPLGPLQAGASVGIACFPHDADDVEQLLKRADQAMYAAKSSGSNHWRRAA